MSSTNKTKNYALSQWVEDDPVLREDFNSDNVKIDTEMKAVRDLASRVRLVVGEYFGTGNPLDLATSYALNAVIIYPANVNGETVLPEMATRGSPSKSITLLPKGFLVSGALTKRITTTAPEGKDNQYRFLAFI